MEKSDLCEIRGDSRFTLSPEVAPCLAFPYAKDGGQATTKIIPMKVSVGKSSSDSKVNQAENLSGHIKHLPYDILLDIISRVPVESVLDCKLVCRTWLSLLTRKRAYFTDMHVRRQLNQLHDGDAANVDKGLLCARTVDGNYEEIALFYGGQYNDKINTEEKYTYKTTLKKIRHPQMRFHMPREYLVGSCNGLICLGRHHDTINDPIYICNPVTGDHTYLPKLNIPARSGPRVTQLARGFGYVRSTNEYKVVRIFFDGYEVEGQVQVYTLGSGCGWRNKDIRFPWGGYEMPGIFANEAIYWIDGSSIYAFDLVNEEFQIVPNPPCFTGVMSRDVKSNFGLVVLGGNLCFYYQNLVAPDMEIWSLNKSKIWIKDFSIVYQMSKKKHNMIYFWPILLTRNDEVIFSRSERFLHSYNPRTGDWKLLVDDPGVDEIVTIPHINTFVSLKAIGEKPSRRSSASVAEELLAIGEKSSGRSIIGEKLSSSRVSMDYVVNRDKSLMSTPSFF